MTGKMVELNKFEQSLGPFQNSTFYDIILKYNKTQTTTR